MSVLRSVKAPEKRVEVVRLQFKDEKTPYSSRFDDIYFAPSTGIEESRYIYLEGSGLIDSIESPLQNILVAEIGFGVGLNFLLTLKEFMARARTEQHLHYISVEKYPVFQGDLEKLYCSYPELKNLSDELISRYPLLTPGIHRIQFFGGRVTLDLVLGDAGKMLAELEFKANHWYFDGFAPSRNADAFSEQVFKEVARLSAPLAKGASFTAATWVRQTLERAGFKISKRPGFGDKRESIQAVYEGPEIQSSTQAWFSNAKLRKINSNSEIIAVLGAGLAGSAIARKFADEGFTVKVFDGNGVAKRASSNTAGIFDVQVSRIPSPISRFAQTAFANFKEELKRINIPYRLGILKEEEHLEEGLLVSDYPDGFFEKRDNKYFLPDCGMIHPGVLCDARLKHKNIELISSSVSRVENTGTRLTLFLENGQLEKFDHVIYANGADLVLPENKLDHIALEALPLRAIRGQTILVKQTANSSNMKYPLMNEGYALPCAQEITGHSHHLIGATYQAKDILNPDTSADTETLLSEARRKWPEFSDLKVSDLESVKVGFRLSTPDKLPLIGPVCDAEKLRELYGKHLRAGLKNTDALSSLLSRPGEWMLLALGSRGITFSSLSAEILYSMMRGSPLPIELDLLQHLHSARFFVRNLKKSQVS